MTASSAQKRNVTINPVVTETMMVTREMPAAQALSPCHHLSPHKWFVYVRARRVSKVPVTVVTVVTVVTGGGGWVLSQHSRSSDRMVPVPIINAFKKGF
ncbi:hypothetical protein [Tardiphaga sp.]|uniref:hypothetical protein n=1 Tax=Tardiphaga sp. TaxID=1926292 RepID=UPI002606BB88|nr:hypothetical protein [Tardiphaga sp.]